MPIDRKRTPFYLNVMKPIRLHSEEYVIQGVVTMESQEALSLEVDKAKIQKVMQIYGIKTEQETINKILDDIIYVEEMKKTMEKYKGKGTFKRVYE